MSQRFHFILRLVVCIATAGIVVLPAFAADAPAKKRVLILGDSISIGYTPFVKEMLKDEALVVRPNGNCEGTTKGVQAIDQWLANEGGKWDVIHFNFGLHDIKHVDPKTKANSNNESDPHQANPEQYEKNLREIVGKLKQSGAKLIFCTTTPVPEGGVKPYRDPADVVKYNDIAKKIMAENDIAIDDLYNFCEPQLAKIQQKVNVHFSKEGSEALAKEVTASIRKALE